MNDEFSNSMHKSLVALTEVICFEKTDESTSLIRTTLDTCNVINVSQWLA